MIKSPFESIRSTLNVLIDSLLQRTTKVVKTFIHTYKEKKTIVERCTNIFIITTISLFFF